NNDSLPDLAFIASDNSGIHIYRNKGEFLPVFQQFIPRSYMTLQGLYCEDYDNNGFTDIAVTHSLGSQEMYISILFNDGNGNFLEDPIISYQTLNFEPQTSNLTCYPNPFTESVNIEFALTEQTIVDLAVFDLNGNQIATLIHKTMPPGGHTITWSGKDLNGKEVKPGIYLLGFALSSLPNHTIKLIKMYI
ncbi:MAG: FG-GAP-like repeat-containing protein, partial [Bacteroidales bacterium]